MRKCNLLLISFTLLFLFACSHTGINRKTAADEEVVALSMEQEVAATYAVDMANLQMLTEEALVWRSKALDFYQKNTDKFGKKNFSHQDLLELFESVKKYSELRTRLMEYSKKFGDHFRTLDLIEIKPGAHTDLKSTLVKIDPQDREGRDFLIRMKISFDASLVLYDNYLTGIYPYVTHRKTRRIINRDIPELHNALEKITDSFFDPNQRLVMLKAQSLFKDAVEFEKTAKLMLAQDEVYLNLLAMESPFYQFLLTKQFDLKKQNAIKAYWDRVTDRFTFMNESFTFIASKTFGNTLGLVAFRAGYLTKLSTEEKTAMAQSFKPLDIMLEKTPFRLTDQFIPGYYGHVALWVGTEEELKELGVWDHPLITKYHDKIRSGHHIIEALRPGVQINSLDHFLNIDDMLVLRNPNMNDEQRKEYVIRAFQQIGKEYDFNFDVETDSKIVCSEIAYVVFHDIEWPTKKQMGRFTISPDNVANKCLDGTLGPVLMYRSGKKIQTDDIIENLRQELKK